MDEMIGTHLYPHGPYAMGAPDDLSDVIVYYINVSTKSMYVIPLYTKKRTRST